ncbi:uncharacterized protein LOC130451150 [Diorhabda sublineata]|uniref:uncharacterized protein LOC130451150 n=1 Tax=Diorhabda sublineata TaxID=1163346 RepID=UPI0024E19068|nr:uncharacterized protein LOC130451150 [Diorhabda sublineata]
MTLSNMTLVKIGAVGGVATVTMGLLYKNQINYNVKHTDFYKDALKTLRTHRGAVYLLGEPIKDRMINVGDVKTNFVQDYTAQYKVPVKGSKQSGYLYFWAEKHDSNKWDVVRMELELDKEPNKRLLIKSSFPHNS